MKPILLVPNFGDEIWKLFSFLFPIFVISLRTLFDSSIWKLWENYLNFLKIFNTLGITPLSLSECWFFISVTLSLLSLSFIKIRARFNLSYSDIQSRWKWWKKRKNFIKLKNALKSGHLSRKSDKLKAERHREKNQLSDSVYKR